ncbi:MAG TPA: T9SS type A sorting domain-containing protein [Bacteroidales bacterium]|nr:T9SS type A sorting domain-containing protein [Bacteroidales bacterium]
MRKFTFLIALIAIASFTFAQHSMPYAAVKGSQKFQKQTQSTKAAGDIIWSVDFEETTPVWSFGEDDEMGSTMWQVIDQDGWNPTLGDPENGWYFFPLGHYSETGNADDNYTALGHWAIIEVLSNEPGFGGPGQTTDNSWIQFDGIDLTGVDAPKLVFYQLFRPINTVASYIDFSIDGGTTWTEVEVNADVPGNEYGDVLFEMLVGPYIGNESNVSIRFRWNSYELSDPYPLGYGWQIDDIKIVENAEYDLKLVDARMNFFGTNYVDYHVSGQEDYFHYSGHYGNVPNEQYDSEYGISWFNVIVENLGMYDATPSVRVEVLDPLGNSVYDETIVGDPLAVGAIDTLDVEVPEFALTSGTEFGEYNVLYEVFEDGVTDYSENNNTYAVTFNVSDNVFSRDLGNITGRVGPGNWGSGGNDGDMIGTIYPFLYDTQIESISIFIDDNTTEGVLLIPQLYTYGTEDWEELASAAMFTVTAADLGQWVDFTFDPPIEIALAGEDVLEVLASVQFFYNGGDAYIGSDASAPTSFWAAQWYFTQGTNANQWFAITNWAPSNIAIRLNTTDTTEDPVALFSADNTQPPEGTQVTFTNESLNADEFSWAFEGGDPATSTDENPVVTYNTVGQYNVTLTVTQTSTGATDTRLIEDYIDVQPTYISPSATESFKVYPNPATDIVTVEANDITRMRVMNSLGQIVFESNDHSVNTFDVSNWNGGWYILEVTSGSEIIRTNVIVK